MKKFLIVNFVAMMCVVPNIIVNASNDDNEIIKENSKSKINKILENTNSDIDKSNTIDDVENYFRKGKKDMEDIYNNIHFSNQENNSINNAPIIIAENKTIIINEKFNPIDDIKAIDSEDGNITNKIKVVENTVNIKKIGIYNVIYEVIDSKGAKAIKTVTIKVINNSKPKIICTENITIPEGIKFNPMDGVKAFDKEDGDITKKIKVNELFDIE